MSDRSDLFCRPYRAVAFDLDGTLLRSDKSIAPSSIAVVKRLIEAGWYVAIATGRHPHSALRYFKELGALTERSLAVIFNGSALISMDSYQKEGCPDTGFATLREDLASGAEIARVAALAHRYNLRVHAYAKRRGLIVEDTNRYTMREIFHAGVAYVEGFVFERPPVDESFYKLIAVGRVEDLDAFRAALTAKMREDFAVMRTDDNFLEFIPHQRSKGAALSWLSECAGIRPEEVVAFGDAENDLLMLKNAGLGVAMGNAAPELKAQADFVTAGNDEDGIAQVLEDILSHKK